MKDQHEKIKGYRDLSQKEIDLMNRIKDHAEKTSSLIEEVKLLRSQLRESSALTPDDINESYRCIAQAKTYLQTGQMWFVRAVALPNSF